MSLRLTNRPVPSDLIRRMQVGVFIGDSRSQNTSMRITFRKRVRLDVQNIPDITGLVKGCFAEYSGGSNQEQTALDPIPSVFFPILFAHRNDITEDLPFASNLRRPSPFSKATLLYITSLEQAITPNSSQLFYIRSYACHCGQCC